MSKEKISKQELKKELENGKTVKEIAYEYGYGHPSRALKNKIWSLGFKERNRFNWHKQHGSASIQLTREEVNKLLEDKDFEVGDRVFANKTVEDGKLVLKASEKQWEKKE